MPSHILRFGLLDESIETNRRSAAAEPDSNGPASLDYLVYAYLKQGRDAEGARVVQRAVQSPIASTAHPGIQLAACPPAGAERDAWSDRGGPSRARGGRAVRAGHHPLRPGHRRARGGQPDAARAEVAALVPCATRSRAARGVLGHMWTRSGWRRSVAGARGGRRRAGRCAPARRGAGERWRASVTRARCSPRASAGRPAAGAGAGAEAQRAYGLRSCASQPCPRALRRGARGRRAGDAAPRAALPAAAGVMRASDEAGARCSRPRLPGPRLIRRDGRRFRSRPSRTADEIAPPLSAVLFQR